MTTTQHPHWCNPSQCVTRDYGTDHKNIFTVPFPHHAYTVELSQMEYIDKRGSDTAPLIHFTDEDIPLRVVSLALHKAHSLTDTRSVK